MPKHLTYFVSDIHLGLQVGDPAQREKNFVKFLREIDPEETSALYLLGDIFDFWYEYRYVVPKGGARVLGALTWLIDSGVKVYFFEGNHDHWCFSYFEELGMVKLPQPYVTDIAGKRFCLGHGDGLGPGNYWYKFLKAVFTSRWAQDTFRGEDEPLYKYCAGFQSHNPVNYFIFGHYHSRVDMPVGAARLHILGDWMTAPNWLVFDSDTATLSARV